MTSMTAVPQMLSAVAYTSTKGQVKAALVVGTPESTEGRVPEGQVTLVIWNPINGRQYFRYAAMNEDGTFHNARELPADQGQDDDDSPFGQDDDDQGAE